MSIAYKGRSISKSQLHQHYPNINAAVIPVAPRPRIPPGPALIPTVISFFQGRYVPLSRACVAQKISSYWTILETIWLSIWKCPQQVCACSTWEQNVDCRLSNRAMTYQRLLTFLISNLMMRIRKHQLQTQVTFCFWLSKYKHRSLLIKCVVSLKTPLFTRIIVIRIRKTNLNLWKLASTIRAKVVRWSTESRASIKVTQAVSIPILWFNAVEEICSSLSAISMTFPLMPPMKPLTTWGCYLPRITLPKCPWAFRVSQCQLDFSPSAAATCSSYCS